MNMYRRAAALLAAVVMLGTAVQAAEPAPEAAVPAAETVEAAGEEAAQLEDWNLLLVNPWHYLPEDFTVELTTLSNGYQVDTRIVEDLNAMLAGCREAGLKPKICSAYRTKAQQTYLHNNKIARLRASGWDWNDAPREAARWVAIPDTSEHQTGMALDIVSSSYPTLNRRQEETAEQKWLMEHCWEYGFILRYPSDKGEITGIGYEPWHYRYVGKETALAMKESGQCLEEYLETLAAQLEAQAEQMEPPSTLRELAVYIEERVRELWSEEELPAV